MIPLPQEVTLDPIEIFILNKFSGHPVAQRYYGQLWAEFTASGLADATFAGEITSGDDGKFWQRVWEMLLARHLLRQGHHLSSADAGPDFRFEVDGKIIWCEAIAPQPVGLPEEWLRIPAPEEFRVQSYPHEAVLLRWTAAIKEKRDKLEGRVVSHRQTGEDEFRQGYRQQRIVADGDCYIIAVNGCQLGPCGFMDGITGLPVVVEAMLPIGPWTVPVRISDGQFGEAYRSVRSFVKNHNGASVPTDNFFDPSFEGVSAVLGSVRKEDKFNGGLGIVVVHNPNARAPLPVGILGATTEYVVRDAGEAYELKLLPAGSIPSKARKRAR